MEYVRNICITNEEFQEILTSGHDCDMYLKICSLIGVLFGTTLFLMTNRLLTHQNEIDNLTQVKRSLMDHIATLEDELTLLYTQEEEEEEEEKEQEDAQEKAASEDLQVTSDLSDKEPHED